MSSEPADDTARPESGAHESARKHWRHAAVVGVEQLHKAPTWVDLEATPSERCTRLDYCSGEHAPACLGPSTLGCAAVGPRLCPAASSVC